MYMPSKKIKLFVKNPKLLKINLLKHQNVESLLKKLKKDSPPNLNTINFIKPF